MLWQETAPLDWAVVLNLAGLWVHCRLELELEPAGLGWELAQDLHTIRMQLGFIPAVMTQLCQTVNCQIIAHANLPATHSRC